MRKLKIRLESVELTLKRERFEALFAQFKCPVCGKELKESVSNFFDTVTCPKCGTVMYVREVEVYLIVDVQDAERKIRR